MVVGLVSSVVIARLGGASIKGIASTYGAWISLSFAVLNFDIPQQALRVGRKVRELNSVLPWMPRVWKLHLLLTLSIVILNLIFDINIDLILLLSILGNLIVSQIGIIVVGVRGAVIGALAAITQPMTALVGVLGLAWSDNLTEDSIKWVIGLSFMSPAIVFLWKQSWKTRYTSKFDLSLWKAFRAGVGWQSIRSIQTFMLKIDLIVVQVVLGNAAAGGYSVAISTAMLANVVPQQFSYQVMTSILHNEVVDLGLAIRRAYSWGGVMALMLGGVGWWLIPKAYGADFESSYIPMCIALVGAIAYGGIQIQSNMIRMRGSRRQFLIVNIVGACVLTILLILLVPRFGEVGAAISFSLGLVTNSFIGGMVCKNIGAN